VPKFTQAIQLIAAQYSSEERRLIRRAMALAGGGRQACQLNNVYRKDAICERLTRCKTAPYDEALNRYTFRFSLCGQLLAVRWGALGGALGSNVATMRNDLIDLQFITCATYFDGLLSTDQKAQLISRQASAILQVMQGQ